MKIIAVGMNYALHNQEMGHNHEDILLFAQNLKSLYPFTGYLIDESLQYYKL